MLDLTARQRQSQTLAPNLLRGLRLLAKSLPELRAEVAAEISSNPAIEDTDHPLEVTMSDVEARNREEERVPDYPEGEFVAGTSRDEEAEERRQAFFDNQVKEETLQAHLLAQLPLSGIPPADWPLAEALVGDLDDDGFYRGSIPDMQMAFGRSEAEIAALLGRIMELDPPGCGARTARECLLAQMDALEDSPYEDDVRAIIERHLDDVAAGRFASVERALGLTRRQYVAALKELRTLNPHPGRAFPGERSRIEYVNPEVHAVRIDGRWFADTDKRSLPEIRISKSFEALLRDPGQSPETKAYVRERIESAQRFRELIAQRQETVEKIAQEIFDRQQDFFTEGFRALKPMTEQEIAAKIGVHPTTVSRTVCDKYASTPFGTVELRRFFTAGAVKTADGTEISQEAVLAELRRLVAAENRASPLSDERLAGLLKERGYPVARRTVAKYRDRLGIPGATQRRAQPPAANSESGS